MGQRIFSLYISLFALAFCLPPASAQNKKKDDNAIVYPFYNGITVGADIYGLGSKLLGSDFLVTEFGVDVNLKNRFFPALEFGYGTTDAADDKGISYKGGGPFFRIGLNYNTMFKKKNDYFLYVGLRYAFSPVKFDVHAHVLEDGIWGGATGNPTLTDNHYGGLVSYNHTGMSANVQWWEFLLGVRVKVFKDIQMGWTIRMKNKLKSTSDEFGDPWLVPGFGKFGSSRLGITYSIMYKLPF